MPCGCGNDNQPAPEPEPVAGGIDLPQNGAQQLEYLGDAVSITFAAVDGYALSTQYYFGSLIHNPQNARKYVRTPDAAKLLTVADGKGALFRLVQTIEARPLPPAIPAGIPVVESGPRMTDLIQSPRPDAHEIGGMTLDDLRAVIAEADEAMLVRWLKDEQAGKNRKTITAALNRALALVTELAR